MLTLTTAVLNNNQPPNEWLSLALTNTLHNCNTVNKTSATYKHAYRTCQNSTTTTNCKVIDTDIKII